MLRCLFTGAWAVVMLFAFAAAAQNTKPANAKPGGPDNLETRDMGNLWVHYISHTDPEEWKLIADKQQSANVRGLKEFAHDALTRSKQQMKLAETPHFLIYTEESPSAAENLALTLERGYTACSQICGISRPGNARDKGQGSNIWRGKMLVFLFDTHHGIEAKKFTNGLHPNSTYQEFSHYGNPAYFPPVLTLNGNGSVDLVLATNAAMQLTALRAMTVAAIFRYRSPKPIEPWVEFGLSFAVANSISLTTDQPTLSANQVRDHQRALDHAAGHILGQSDLDDYLTSRRDLLNYPDLYEDLTVFMIHQSGTRFTTFLKGMKDGLTWKDSLESKYGIKEDRLASAFKRQLAEVQ